MGSSVLLTNPMGAANARNIFKCGFERAADSTAHACLLEK